ncbi:MAG TPA: OmpA family protein [Vicinamibacterales bacterium]|nr:OmpA family protein [Vicinamibacterales bacterium]
MRRVFLIAMMIGAVTSWPAGAQDNTRVTEERPATATYWGDTGLWFVPTAETLRPRGFSFSVYRTEFDFKQGLTDVSDWPITAAVGAGSRAEIFGSFHAVTRIDRDTRPLFQPGNVQEGGLVNEVPLANEPWSGNTLGDLYFGGKVNILTEHRNQPFALAFRGTAKAPTADKDKGAGTGEWDYFADGVVSKEIVRRIEVSGYTGFAWRGDPSGINISDGWRWGVGAAWGARSYLRLTTEIFGEETSKSEITAVPGAVVGSDGSVSPVVSDLSLGTTTAVGLTYQHPSGVSLGAGFTYQSGLGDVQESDQGKRGWGMQFRVGFHRGVSVFVPPRPPFRAEGLAPPPPPPPPPAPEPPPPPPPVVNRQPTIHATCNPCRIEVGKSSAISADAQDPDGDTLQYRWTTPAGTIVDPRALSTTWTAETAPGTVALTVTADDGKGGVATDTVNIEVVRTVPNLSFNEVHFDFDQSVIRPDARTILDRAVMTLKEYQDVRVKIGGHASNEGTPEHNMALSERRANAVKDYLVSHGIAGARLTTQGFGENQPKYDNSKEETRKLNRRADLSAEGDQK